MTDKEVIKTLELDFMNHTHLPETVKLFEFISELDFYKANDYFHWKSGGDGDNGEILMNEIDEYFKTHNKGNKPYGHWVKISTHKDRSYQCSICGNTLDFHGVNVGRGDANYCPNCGAKMDEVEE